MGAKVDMDSAQHQTVPGDRSENSTNESMNKEKQGYSKWSFGVLNDRDGIDVPGSVMLLATGGEEPLVPQKIHSQLPAEKKKSKDGAFFLEPQPDDSDNDPLNWPLWRRNVALLSMGFYCMVGGGISSMMAAGFTDIAHDYNVKVESVSLIVGLFMTGQGLGSVFASPTAILFGKRPIYLTSVMIFIATCIWAGLSPNFPSLLLARIFQGLSISPIECLPSATIAEIFFLHERAYRIGVYTLLLLGGKNLIPLVGAAIIGGLGWRWVFFIIAFLTCFSFLVLFLFVPETFWDRTPPGTLSERSCAPRCLSSQNSVTLLQDAALVHNVGESPGQKNDDINRIEAAASQQVEPIVQTSSRKGAGAEKFCAVACVIPDVGREPGLLSNPESVAQSYTDEWRQRPAKSFAQLLRPYNGRLKSDNWLKVMLRPFVLFLYPAVLWSAAVYSCSVGWLMVISQNLAIIYRNPDSYNFTSFQTGLVYISPFIGGVLGTAVAGKISDAVVHAMASRNGGLYEPEFRLVMAIPIMISTCIGLMGFGWSAEVKDHWIVPTLFFGILSFGSSLGSTTAITFCLDSYKQYAGEALVTLNFAKNIFHGLVFSLFVSHWVLRDGAKMVFMWLGIVQVVLQLTTIPLFIYGKRARMWTVRRNFMGKL